MKKKKNSKAAHKKAYKSQLFKRILLVILAFAAMISSSSMIAGRMINNLLRSQTEAAITQARMNIESDFSGPMTAVNLASDAIREMLLRGADADEIHTYLENISTSLERQTFRLEIGRMYGYFEVFDGGLYLDARSGNRQTNYDPSLQPWYIAAVEADGALGMTSVIASRHKDGEMISCSRRIFDENGKPLGVLAVNIPFNQLHDHLSQLRFSGETDGSYGFLMNNKLDVIAHPNPDAEGKGIYDMLPHVNELSDHNEMKWLEEELHDGEIPSEYELMDLSGVSMVACSTELSNGWILTLVTPFTAYYGDLIRMELILWMIGAVLSAALIFMLVRLNKRTAERDAQLAKLEAVAQNYKGIMWSVDSKDILTTLRGQYMRKLKLDPDDFEGQHIQTIQPYFPMDFLAYAEKSKTEGPQDWSFEMDGITYYSYMALTYDENGRATGIVGSIDDITEQAMLQQKLEEALADAEIANTAKSSFLANMSHEIRTPMNAILGITEILVQNETLPADITEGLAKIYNSCDMLLGIINDVLDFSKIEAGKLDITPAAYKVASLVNDSIHLNMMRIGSRPIEFTLEIDDKIPAKLIGDELRIKQILNNLLSNAFKYTDSGTVTLQVGFERDKENSVTLILGVQDTGQGMSKEQIDKLFDEYTRFQSDSGRTVEGTGLGMAITRRLLHLMNGVISLESKPEQGSLFVVRLPQEVVDEEELGAELAENLRNFKMSLITNKERVQLVRDPMPYGKVLVVDDVETNIYVALGLFKLYGLQTDTAISGYEAIEKIKNGSVYDIVFMDHMMPGMDGIEATKQLRAMGYQEPVVALTANAVTKNADLFLQNGFDHFIAKPIDIRQLNAILNKLVRDKQPPEVIEEARRQKKAQPAADPAVKAELDPLLLSSFVRDARKAVTVLEEWHGDEASASEERLKQFTITVHGMKTALANIGESALSAAAKELELAGKDSNSKQIRQSAPDFLEQLRALIAKTTLRENDEDQDEDVSELRVKLAAIQEMCDEYDRKGATAILAELGRQTCSRQTRETIERIMEAVLHSDFEEAAEMAAAYAAQLPAGDLEVAIEGLDMKRGLARYDGDEETYIKILRSYAASLDRLLGVMEGVSAQSIKDYEIAVHGVKGASRDIFAEAIGQAAADLEAAAKAGDLDYIHRHHEQLHDEARRLAGDITSLLARIDAKKQKPKKDKPEGEILTQLLQACEMYDMDGVDAAMAQISAYEYETDGGLAVWLQERANVTDFASIAQRLSDQDKQEMEVSS